MLSMAVLKNMNDTQLAALMKKIERVRRSVSGKNPPRRSSGGRRHSMLGVKLPPKYRDPKDQANVWAGRGLKPVWLQEALKKRGAKLEHYLVPNRRATA